MLTRIVIDMNIDIDHDLQEEREAHVRIDREAETDVNIIDPEVKHFFIFYFVLYFIFLYILLFNCFLFLLKK